MKLRLEGYDLRGALVRFRYRVFAKDLHLVDAAAIERALFDAGAHEVQIEAVVEHQSRVRSEEIVTTTTTVQKVEAWLRAKQIQLDAAALARLRLKVEQLEGGLHAAA